uniref:presenilin-associated rhomboid-like protein, mitochondrial isoform X3 n=1 Tax=Doryrhamphus excisus TaxID=161450 RepID=UPI0025AE3FEC|nr:presenilin-associated rhomboid-like protein, mitochondrial isoform X3 [Doryrhamphus excisus]
MAWRSCAVLFCRTGDDVLWSVKGGSVSNRWPHSFQQRCGFRKVSRKPETKKVDEELGPAYLDSSEVVSRQQLPSGSPRSFSRLLRPLVFTVGFTGCSFGSAAIWQYESLKSRVQSYFDELRADWMEKVRPQKRGDARKEFNQWWNSLSDGQRTVTAIIATNLLVFCCWRVPSLQRSMIKYFTADPASSEDTVLAHAAVHLQPLLLLPHGGQHVRPVELLQQRRLHAGPRAVHGRLPVCRCYFLLRQLRGQDGHREVWSFSRSVWRHHDHPGCGLHQNARSQAGHHLPPNVHLHCRQRAEGHHRHGCSRVGVGVEVL